MARDDKSGMARLIVIGVAVVGLLCGIVFAVREYNGYQERRQAKDQSDAVLQVQNALQTEFRKQKSKELDAYKLVEHHMTSLDPVERDAAIKALRDMGDKAEPALKEGAKSKDPDIAKKCGELLTALKRTKK